MIGALDIVSADDYGWTDPYEWSQANPRASTGHYGAWVYGHAIDRARYYNPEIPAYGFIECCGLAAAGPQNTMMPGMIVSGRGLVYWTTDFLDSSSGGDPQDEPYPGATYYGNYALYGDHQWDAQYSAARGLDQQVELFAPELNSPTVSDISATSPSGVPIAVLGKDVGGKLWLLAQADGDAAHQLSNTNSISATITLPSAVRPGAVLQVVGEHRTVTVNANHQITDTFGTTTETPTYSGKPLTYGYQHHVYAMK